jgi:hypothetical protein
MKNLKKKREYFKRAVGFSAAVVFLIGGLRAGIALADEPFAAAEWQKVDQFVESHKPEAPLAASPEAPPVASPAAPEVTPSAEPGSEQMLPTSTTEDRGDRALVKKALDAVKPVPPPTTSSAAPPLPSVEKSAEGTSALPVRLTTLPNRQVKPIAAAPAVRPRKKEAVKTPPKKDEPPISQQACEALSEMRKRELAAIEKDRQTLTALQAAIKDLGLGNKLSLTKEKGSLLSVQTPDMLKGTASNEAPKPASTPVAPEPAKAAP